jgi:hypothetical protein
MEKSKILESIEEGLLDYYLSIDYSLRTKDLVAEEPSSYDVDRYKKLAKRILFKAKFATQNSLQEKVISISEASGRLATLDEKMKGRVFPMFKRHVEKYGLAANYRNFDAMTEDEMANILRQLNLTSLFDEILDELGDE